MRFSLVGAVEVDEGLDELQPGTRVHLEVDVLARYVARLEETRV